MEAALFGARSSGSLSPAQQQPSNLATARPSAVMKADVNADVEQRRKLKYGGIELPAGRSAGAGSS